MSRRNDADKPLVRCAIYTRKSTEEGLEQEYNTLYAQREAGESYVRSQRHEGWQCLPERYDDGGYTGANMDRPALRRLLADIEAGKVDCVIVYKVDRLSRGLLDFGRMMETFDKHQAAFVSVTQAFNTASSMGRLVLNVLLSFAQFEREMISERTRDKIAATRRKGKWAGGMPVLGYTVENSKLVVDEAEANQVRQIFDLYLEHQSLLEVVDQLDSPGWRTKRRTTRKARDRGGRAFAKNSLYQLLTNVAYVGKVRYKNGIHEREHMPIIDAKVFDEAQSVLSRNGRSDGRAVRNKHRALLRGLLRCPACECGMSHSYSVKGSRRYRYCVCQRAQKRGWQECQSPSIPAGEIERFVVDQIKCIGRDPAVIRETLTKAREKLDAQVAQLKLERTSIAAGLRHDHAEVCRLAGSQTSDARMADINDRLVAGQLRPTEIAEELADLDAHAFDETDVVAALGGFDALWDCLAAREQARGIELLVERVDYVGDAGNVSITFGTGGFRSLAAELVRKSEEVAA